MFILKLALALIIIIAALVMIFRYQRQIIGESARLKRGAEKERASNPHELEEFIAAYRRDKALGVTPAVVSNSPSDATPEAQLWPNGTTSPATASATATAPAKAREAFLAGPAKLAFLVLKAGLPDHHVFASTRLADLVDGNPAVSLSSLKIDLLVCGKDLGIVAAVDLGSGGPTLSTMERDKQRQLQSLGIRYVRLQPGALPKTGEVRRIIYGDE